MRIKKDISAKIAEFKKLCATHKVRYLYAFGSSTNETFDESTSDIDLLVDIELNDPVEKGEILMDLWDQFELFFNRKVDLLTNNSVKNPYLRKSIDSTKILLYDGEGEEAFV